MLFRSKNNQYPLGEGQEWGDWTPEVPDSDLYACGYYVTKVPIEWYSPGMALFVAETRGKQISDDERTICTSIRLRRATRDEREAVQWFDSGEHTVREGRAVALNSAKVVAFNSAKVTAQNSAGVIAHDSVRVTAFD